MLNRGFNDAIGFLDEHCNLSAAMRPSRSALVSLLPGKFYAAPDDARCRGEDRQPTGNLGASAARLTPMPIVSPSLDVKLNPSTALTTRARQTRRSEGLQSGHPPQRGHRRPSRPTMRQVRVEPDPRTHRRARVASTRAKCRGPENVSHQSPSHQHRPASRQHRPQAGFRRASTPTPEAHYAAAMITTPIVSWPAPSSNSLHGAMCRMNHPVREPPVDLVHLTNSRSQQLSTCLVYAGLAGQ